MKKIMTGVTCVLAVLIFCIPGVLAEKKLNYNQEIKIELSDAPGNSNGETLEIKIEIDANGKVDISHDPPDGETWVETVDGGPPSNAEEISVHSVNPCYVCIGSRCWKKSNC